MFLDLFSLSNLRFSFFNQSSIFLNLLPLFIEGIFIIMHALRMCNRIFPSTRFASSRGAWSRSTLLILGTILDGQRMISAGRPPAMPVSRLCWGTRWGFISSSLSLVLLINWCDWIYFHHGRFLRGTLSLPTNSANCRWVKIIDA